MVIKEGYKQTEIGVIPMDWEFTSINGLVENNIIFKPLDGNHGNIHPKSSDFVFEGIPFVMANNVQNGKVDITTCKFIKKEQADNLQKGFSINGDVLFTHKGTVGNVAIVQNITTEYIMLTPQVTYYRVKDEKQISKHYLKQYFEGSFFQKFIENISGGGTRAYIGITSQRMLPFILPPIAEQTTIANTLSDADGLITGLEKLIAKKRKIKQGAMQQLLQPKEGWEVRKLGEICDFYNGKGHEQSISENGNYIVVNSKFVSTQGEVYKCSTENLFPLEKNDITIVMSDIPNGKALAKCFIIPEDNKYTLNQRIGAVRTNVLDYKFLYFILNRNDYYLAFDSGTGQTNLKKNDILDCPVSLPPTKEEQTQIATILSDMNAELSSLEQKLEKYKKVKLGMMQELLTGKTRLV